MKRFILTFLLASTSSPALAEEVSSSALQSHWRVGLALYEKIVPLPSITGSLYLGQGFSAEASASFLIAAGAGELGLRYWTPALGAYQPSFSLRTGKSFSMVHAESYQAFGMAVTRNTYAVELSPVWYRSRDFRTDAFGSDRASWMLSMTLSTQ